MPKNDDDYGSVATRRQSHSTCCRKGGRKHPLKFSYIGPTATILAPARIWFPAACSGSNKVRGGDELGWATAIFATCVERRGWPHVVALQLFKFAFLSLWNLIIITKYLNIALWIIIQITHASPPTPCSCLLHVQINYLKRHCIRKLIKIWPVYTVRMSNFPHVVALPPDHT
jgi:hypothetical protein